MASIEKRTKRDGTHSWRVRFWDGTRFRDTTFATEQHARKWLALLDAVGYARARQALDQPRAAAAPSVTACVTRHIDLLTGVQEGTKRRYRSYLPDLGELADLPVSVVTEADVAGWVNSLTDASRRLSPKSIKNRHSLLSAALARAAAEGHTEHNPAKGTRLPRAISHEMTFLTQEEFSRFLACVPEYYRPLVLMLAGTGMRIGEATALQWRHLDLDARVPTARIMQAWKETHTTVRELGPPKTARSQRTVALPSPLVPLLRADTRRTDPNAFVFVTPSGEPVVAKHFHGGPWTDAVREFAGDVPTCTKPARGRTRTTWERGPGKRPRVHDLRHSFVAWSIQAGKSLAVIQRHLGHESIQTTVDRYGHLVRSDLDAMADVMQLPTTPPLDALGA